MIERALSEVEGCRKKEKKSSMFCAWFSYFVHVYEKKNISIYISIKIMWVDAVCALKVFQCISDEGNCRSILCIRTHKEVI